MQREDAVNRAQGRAYCEGNKRNCRCWLDGNDDEVLHALKENSPSLYCRGEHALPLNIYWRKHAGGSGVAFSATGLFTR